jgi:uncharacterized protein YegJ (DUF2314 family)
MKITTTIKGKYQLDKWQENDHFFVKVYNNNAKKAYNRLKKYYRFSSEQSADDYIKRTLESIQSSIDAKEKRKQERLNFKNPAKVGDILESMWGYDQTNIDYYQVIEVKNKSVKIKAINKQFLENDSYGQDLVKPAKNSFKNEKVLTKMVRAGFDNDKNDYYVKINSFMIADLWDGKPSFQTDAYSGH